MNFLPLLAGAGGTAAAGGSTNPVSMILILALMFGVMYFVMIRPQKKKQKEEEAMRDNVQIGDDITTIGGIMGKVVSVKEDCLVIETGADRNKMRIARWAVSTNNTAAEKAEAEREAVKQAQEAEKQAKIDEQGKNSTRKKSKKNKDADE